MNYRLVGKHDENLSCGQMLGPGETSDRVDPSNPHDKELIDLGRLVPIEEKEVSATNAAIEKAAELNVDLESVSGTGSGGNITVDDVVEAAKAAEAAGTSADDENEKEDD